MRKGRIIALLLSVVMIATFIPNTVIDTVAEHLQNVNLQENIETAANPGMTHNVNNQDDENYIVGELTEKRTEHSKKFLMTDGTIMEQVFSVPVHYKGDDDTYREIDNSFLLNTDDPAHTYYENAANVFKAKFFVNSKNSGTVSINRGDYSLFFSIQNNDIELPNQTEAVLSLADAAKSGGKAKANRISDSDAVDYTDLNLKEPLQPKIEEASLTYQNVFDNVDFSYSVHSSGIKEDIVVYEPLPRYEFSFRINAEGLTLQLRETGEIIASDGNEIIFIIPAPNMTDQNGCYSEAVRYELAEHGDGTYELTVIAEKDWINDASRAFPVTIDPAIVDYETNNANGLTLYYANASPREYNAQRIKFGKIDDFHQCLGFISFPNENDQSYFSGYQLSHSKLNFYARSVGTGAGKTTYQVKAVQSTVPLSAVSQLNEMYLYGARTLFSGAVESTQSIFSGVTHGAQWEEAYFDPEVFSGCKDMTFLFDCLTASDDQHGEIDVRSGNLPSILHYYVSAVGIKENLPYERFDYNGGSASVNLINGALTAAFNALSLDAARNPLSLQLVYNDGYDEIMEEFGMYQMFGKNIKVNFQSVINHSGDIATEKAVRYIDADGSIETLRKGAGPFYSVDKNLVYTMPPFPSLYADSNTKLSFDEVSLNNNCLIRYYDIGNPASEKLMYAVFYDSEKKITQIAGYTDGFKTHYIQFYYGGEGRVANAQSYVATDRQGTGFQFAARCDFSYDDEGNLIKISNHGSGNTKFRLEYADGKLCGITDFDGNGYLFARTNSASLSPVRMSAVQTIYGESPAYGGHYVNYSGYASFAAYGNKTTKVEYYSEEGKKAGERTVSRSLNAGFQSEWETDDDGEISIVASSSELKEQNDYALQYIQKVYATAAKENTSLSGATQRSVAPGSAVSGSIAENHGVPEENGGQYCLSLMLENTGSSYVEISVGGIKKSVINVNHDSKAYYIIPVPYYSENASTAIEIKNLGENYVYVSNVSYNHCESVKTTRTIDTRTAASYTSGTETIAQGVRQTAVYDSKGNPLTVTQTDYTKTPAEETTYTYTYAEAGIYGRTNLQSVSDGTHTTEYGYFEPTEGALKTTVTTRDGENRLIRTESTFGGLPGAYYQISVQDGITVRTDYAVAGGNVRPYRVMEGGKVTEYAYNADGNVTEIKVNGALVQSMEYEGANGRVSGYLIGDPAGAGSIEAYYVTRDSAKYNLVTGIGYNNSPMLSFDYNGYGDLSAVTYANGWREEYAYSGRTLQSVTLKEGNIQNTVISYGYTGNELTSITQGNGYAAQLTYGFAESKTESESTVSGEVNASYRYEYGEKSGNLKSIESTLGDSSHTRTETLEYAEGEYGELTSWGDDWLAVLYGYDGIGRLSTRKVRVGNTERQQLRYEYADRAEGEETYLSGRIGKITNETTNAYQTYSYDSKGYVRRYYNSGSGEEYNYTYDGLGRLTTDGVKEYTYDHLNNVTRIESGGNLTELYGYAMRPTQLANTVENGSMKYYRYDEQGNMTLYKGESFSDTDNLYWTRGNLLSYGSIGGYFNYRYGPDNLRYYKLAQGKITKYYWSGNTLMGESTGESYTQYIYDATGIAGMICDGSYYYFEKNLFGDVVKAYDANGTEVAAFRYDAYGNILYESGSMAEKVKIRYRGYYYDAETGFYYLQSRYYAPTICRFISSDQYELIPTLSQIPGQLNLYAYCNNNPVMFTDESGYFWDTLFDIGFIIWGIVDLVNGGWKDWKNWVALVVDILLAAIPFVPAGVGQVVKVGNKVDNIIDTASALNKLDNLQDFHKVTMIGESMDRVRGAASILGVTDNLYDAWKGYDAMISVGKIKRADRISKLHNGFWLYNKLRSGYVVLDAGIDIFKATRSPWYKLESRIVKMWRYRQWVKVPVNLM